MDAYSSFTGSEILPQHMNALYPHSPQGPQQHPQHPQQQQAFPASQQQRVSRHCLLLHRASCRPFISPNKQTTASLAAFPLSTSPPWTVCLSHVWQISCIFLI
jgi:hypothetical protein